jgi:GTP pyrophosphokinase
MVTQANSNPDTQLVEGLSEIDTVRVVGALEFVTPIYVSKNILTEQNTLEYAKGVASILAMLNADADTRIAGILFPLTENEVYSANLVEEVEHKFGKEVVELIQSVRQLMRLRDATLTQHDIGSGKDEAERTSTQMEALRKMVLAMAHDTRVVLIRLASRLCSLRYFAECKRDDGITLQFASETMDLYAPLANRLGVWQLKWELEDLAFRFLEPEQYKRIAKMLEERRIEREDFVVHSIARLQKELHTVGVKAEVTGRPKHIYSIWKKMKGKDVNFDELYDVRAFRVVVDEIKDCYTVLGILNHLWTPIPQEFDDYISRPKPNGYKSLHTVVVVDDGRPLEVQIRTREMHQLSEYGVAAHWRYKESGGSNFSAQAYDEKIASLRQLIAWKNEAVDDVNDQEELQRDWVEKIKAASIDDRVYVLTPQARVIELSKDATPIDFAYQLHTDLGHRCRGARVDNVMVPLNTPLKNGQTVEIISLKIGSLQTGPSRDWLNSEFAASPRTRSKIRAWFNAIVLQETLANGRAMVEKTLQREGKTSINLEELAHKLSFNNVDELFIAVGKEEFGLRPIEMLLRDNVEVVVEDEPILTNKSRASSVASGAKSGVLVVGTDGLMTQLARCCKPAPPDPIIGFVTRGKGVSIHRMSCKNYTELRSRAPERIIQTAWGEHSRETVFPVDILVIAQDRRELLREVLEVYSREKVNVTSVQTQSTKGLAKMSFTVEVNGTSHLQKTVTLIREINGVTDVLRQ